jgi:hypothetical protein
VGIDIFLKWDGMENRPKDDKIEMFSTTDGHLGYLRESYRGGPYATQILVREAFESRTCIARIPAAKMRARLTEKSQAATGCNGGHAIAMFMAQAVHDHKIAGPEDFERIINENRDAIIMPDRVTPDMSVEEAVREQYQRVYPEAGAEHVEAVIQSFRDFVELAERKEKELGRPCKVYASY